MRIVAAAVLSFMACCAPAWAQCTPQIVYDLQLRGVHPALIAQMCGGNLGQPVQLVSSVCATNFGFCPYRGPLNTPCTCVGPMGAVPGIAR
jgi:hypothetical protein